MSKEKQLVKNTLIYAFGNFGSKLLTFLLLPIYSSYLTQEEFGTFDLIVNTAALIIPIITFQIMDGIYRFILTEKDESKVKKYITNGVFVALMNIAIFTVLYLILNSFLNIENKFIIYFYLITNIFYTLWAQIARGLKKNLEYAIAGIIITVLTLVFNIIFIIKFNFKVNGLVVSYIIANVCAFIYLEGKVKITRFIDFKLRSKNIKIKLCKYSVPLIPNTMSWWMMNASDRYMILYFLNSSVNGLYAMANKFSSIIVIINSFFSLAWQESAIVEYENKDRDEYYTKMFNIYMKIQLAGTIVLIPFTKLIFNFLVRGEFLDGYKLVPILYIASVFSAFSVFYGTGYLSANDTKGSFNTTLIGAIINILLNFITIPAFGMYGAAISTLVAYLIVWVVRIKQTKKYFNIKIENKNLFTLTSIVLVFSGLYYINNVILQIILFIIATIIFILYNKELFLKIIQIVKKIIKR